MTFLTNLSLLFVFPAGSDDRIQPWRHIFWYKRKYQVCFCIERWYGRVRVRVRVCELVGVWLRVIDSVWGVVCVCVCTYVRARRDFSSCIKRW